MKALFSILSLLLTLNLGTIISIEKSCGMQGCTMKKSTTCCCNKDSKKSCCTSKYSCSRSDFDGTTQPAVQVVIGKQTTLYDIGETAIIPQSVFINGSNDFKRQKFKPDLQLNMPLLI